jgi:gamma-glutamylcyclotransferase
VNAGESSRSNGVSAASRAIACASTWRAGRPRGKAAPANICTDPDCEVWGVPGRNYRHVLVPAEDANGNTVMAVAYMARGKDTDGTPSHRYMSLLREGARAHGLPDDWLRFLDSVEHHAE